MNKPAHKTENNIQVGARFHYYLFKCRRKVTLLLTSPTYQGMVARSAGSKLGVP